MNPLIDLEEIAQMHRCCRRHARDVVVKRPGFPKEAPTSTQRVRLWVREEVLAFVTRRKPEPDYAKITHEAASAP